MKKHCQAGSKFRNVFILKNFDFERISNSTFFSVSSQPCLLCNTINQSILVIGGMMKNFKNGIKKSFIPYRVYWNSSHFSFTNCSQFQKNSIELRMRIHLIKNMVGHRKRKKNYRRLKWCKLTSRVQVEIISFLNWNVYFLPYGWLYWSGWSMWIQRRLSTEF